MTARPDPRYQPRNHLREPPARPDSGRASGPHWCWQIRYWDVHPDSPGRTTLPPCSALVRGPGRMACPNAAATTRGIRLQRLVHAPLQRRTRTFRKGGAPACWPTCPRRCRGHARRPHRASLPRGALRGRRNQNGRRWGHRRTVPVSRSGRRRAGGAGHRAHNRVVRLVQVSISCLWSGQV